MNKEKKIEDLLKSISELITEAQDARLKINEVRNINSNQSEKAIIPKINKNGEKEKTLTNSNWKDIEFKNFQNYLESKNIKNKEIIEKKKNIFKEKMEEWTKKNLKQIFENQINLKSKELIAEKLK